MFHLLTLFSNNTAEQERYYIMDMLKEPRRISIYQIVQLVEQLISYIAQLLAGTTAQVPSQPQFP
jgi:hypothetical protein